MNIPPTLAQIETECERYVELKGSLKAFSILIYELSQQYLLLNLVITHPTYESVIPKILQEDLSLSCKECLFTVEKQLKQHVQIAKKTVQDARKILKKTNLSQSHINTQSGSRLQHVLQILHNSVRETDEELLALQAQLRRAERELASSLDTNPAISGLLIKQIEQGIEETESKPIFTHKPLLHTIAEHRRFLIKHPEESYPQVISTMEKQKEATETLPKTIERVYKEMCSYEEELDATE